MITWMKELFFLLKQYRKAKKQESNFYNAKKHALLALAYWKQCVEHLPMNSLPEMHFQVENTNIYIRMGHIEPGITQYNKEKQ